MEGVHQGSVQVQLSVLSLCFVICGSFGEASSLGLFWLIGNVDEGKKARELTKSPMWFR